MEDKNNPVDNLEDKKTEKENNNSKITFSDRFFDFVKESPPLFMPVGSVRAILAIILIFICGLLLLKGIIVPEWLYSSVVVVLGFYFGSRKGKQK